MTTKQHRREMWRKHKDHKMWAAEWLGKAIDAASESNMEAREECERQMRGHMVQSANFLMAYRETL